MRLLPIICALSQSAIAATIALNTICRLDSLDTGIQTAAGESSCALQATGYGGFTAHASVSQSYTFNVAGNEIDFTADVRFRDESTIGPNASMFAGAIGASTSQRIQISAAIATLGPQRDGLLIISTTAFGDGYNLHGGMNAQLGPYYLCSLGGRLYGFDDTATIAIGLGTEYALSILHIGGSTADPMDGMSSGQQSARMRLQFFEADGSPVEVADVTAAPEPRNGVGTLVLILLVAGAVRLMEMRRTQ